MQRAVSLAGKWGELDWDEMEAALDRLRNVCPPTPSLTLSDAPSLILALLWPPSKADNLPLTSLFPGSGGQKPQHVSWSTASSSSPSRACRTLPPSISDGGGLL